MNIWLQKMLGVDWYDSLIPFVESDDFELLGMQIAGLRGESTIYPPRQDMFKAFRMCPVGNLKVVILGQDPYHDGSADGIAFSNSKTTKISPSLLNILKEVGDKSPYSMGKDLSRWAEQGVLLLNTAQTVQAGQPGSHLKLWETFTEEVIKVINKNPNIVVLLLGAKAQAFESKFNKYHVILKTSHPSPFSAHKGFIGSGIFQQCNEELEKMNKKPISW
jgi:uracil-DNA glycosylase